MKFVLDHCVPRPLLNHLTGFDVSIAGKLGFAELGNGKLLAAAEQAGYAALITVDKGFAKQQSMKGRKISVLLLDVADTRIKGLIPLVPALVSAMGNLTAGSFITITPDRPA